MRIDVELATQEEAHAWRELHRKEMDCQIILDSWLGRGWADGYILQVDGRAVGYGLAGGIRDDPKTIVTEFYVLLPYRRLAQPLFRRFVKASRARSIEVQTNDPLLTLMLYDFAESIEPHAVLFHDALTTGLPVEEALFRLVEEADRDQLAAAGLDRDAGWLVESRGEVVAAGGLLFHYNPPYGDIFMAVAERFRRRGYGSYLVQELKRACYEMGKVPAARCNATNTASRSTLQKAGLLPCARVLTGSISERTRTE